MDDIGQLIRHAGARDAVPPSRFGPARESVMKHWQQVVSEQGRRRRATHLRLVAVAASVMVVAVVSGLYLRSGDVPAPVMMATVERVTGPVYADNSRLGPGDTVARDARIETGAGSRIALRLGGGQSLRLDTSSEVIVHAGNRLTLQGGGLYVDTEGLADAPPVLVMTRLGDAQDVGTQFQVRYVDEVLTVGVREGLVEITRPDKEKLAVDSGRFVDLGADGSRHERLSADRDPAWNWVEDVAPPFDIDGASLTEYLNWYARQRGFELAWSDAESERLAGAIILSGTIDGTSLEEGLQIVHRIARFEHTIDGSVLRIAVK